DRRLGQPVRVLEPGHEPGLAQRAGGRHDRLRLEEQIEVLGLAVDPGVLVDRVGAGDDVRDAPGVQGFERLAVDSAFLVGDPEIAMCDRLALLRRELPRATSLGSGHAVGIWPRVWCGASIWMVPSSPVSRQRRRRSWPLT